MPAWKRGYLVLILVFEFWVWRICGSDEGGGKSGGNRKAKFLSFFNNLDLTNSHAIENLRTDIESAKFLLHAIKETSVSKDKLHSLQDSLDQPLEACPLNRGAVKIDKSCYEFFPEKVTFPRARQVCKSLGGDLASIHLQLNFLSQIRKFYPKLAIDGTHFETWVGATRIPGTRNFQFFDGRVIYSSNARWNSGPRNHNCLILDDVDLAQDFIIDDCDCFNKRSFLCQYPLTRIL